MAAHACVRMCVVIYKEICKLETRTGCSVIMLIDSVYSIESIYVLC